ncbi:MAG: hypothetical protein DRJ42_14515 [Deltaproteobacteria bacterium]|nr:MAG: hypothetical protein DRJ42_14515 [Deltaproteobacteria bacterium]
MLTFCMLSLLAVVIPEDVSAQIHARRRVPAGEVTGLDMAIDGSLEAIPGGRVRWFVTLYEVVGQRNLRPAAGATLTATASFAPAEAIATVVTDALGRAALELPIPDDLESSVELRVEATSPRNVSRVFSVSLERGPRYELILLTDRALSAPRGRVMAFGRLLDRATGRPVEGATVTTRVIDQAVHGAVTDPPPDVTTDGSGVFATTVDLGPVRGVARLLATASITSANASGSGPSAASPLVRAVSVTATLRVQEVPVGGLWATATTERPFATPGEVIPVVVRGFAPQGRPLVGARVRVHGDWGTSPTGDGGALQTNSDGEVTLEVRVPTRVAGGEWVERFELIHPGYGATAADLRVRVEAAPVLAAASVQGGALVPELEGRVFVRVVTPDGVPFRDGEVHLEAPRLGGTLAATTDADGVASFTARVASGIGDSRDDACGGATAAAATLVVGAHRQLLCLPVDLDGTLTVSASTVTGPGEPLAVTVARRPRVGRRPVEVVALVQRAGRWLPVARTLLGARTTRSNIDVPSWVRGEVWLRGRPLLEDGVPGRGGGTFVYLGDAPSSLEVEADGEGARVVGTEGDRQASTTLLFAVDVRAASALGESLGAQRGPLAMALREGRGSAFLAAIAGAETPRDETASAVLREGVVTTQPLPQTPVAHGLLRDPWRTRARFIRGRVGRLMRGVESYVAGQEPGAMEDVATFHGRRAQFNASILDATAMSAGLGDEAMASLGGEPLEIASLTTLDAAFTFDNVARRITRERLFRLLVLLREHMHARGLDRPWARRGDPAEYLTTLLDGGTSFSGDWPESGHLYDGWGRPFVLRPARGGSRFTFLEPVSGWELISAGPDGRAGTGDDLVDPFARVLPSGGLYAEAVGEDVLLARLRGVALGRATVASLAEVFEIDVPEVGAGGAAPVQGAFRELPGPSSSLSQRALLRPAQPHLGEVFGGVGDHQEYRLPSAHRPYAAVAVAFRRDGGIDLGTASFDAGVPFSARVPWPVALRAGERLAFPVDLVQYADGGEPRVEVFARGGIVRASIVARETTRERTREGAEVLLEALRPGLARVVLRTTMADGRVTTETHRLRVVPDGNLRARHGAAVAAPEAHLDLTVPEGATPWRGQLVIGAPQALAADPAVAAALENHPAIASWAATLSPGAVAPSLEAHLDGSAGAAGESLPSDIDRACALVAWAARQGRPDGASGVGRFNHLARNFGASVSGDLRTRAAILTALATAAPPVPTGGIYDPVAGLINKLREDGWRALAAASGEPAVMARMAAALLIIDARDGPGRALYRRARASLEADGQGRRTVPGDPTHPGDAVVGTLALALAARQVGDDALADELRTSALRRLHQVPRLGAEGAFWPVAASVLGAFGMGAPDVVQVEIDGAPQQVDLGDTGVRTLDVRPGAAVVVRGGGNIWVRAETRYLVPAEVRDAGVLRASIEGAPGAYGERAGFEVVVKNTAGEPLRRPVIEVVLPGAGRFDDEAKRMIESAPGVHHVAGLDGAGVLRIVLESMRVQEERRFALPLLWIARGQTTGLDLASYDAAAPWRVSTTPRRVFSVDARDARDE